MNICIVTSSKISPINGGVQNVCYNLAQFLSETTGHKIYNLYIHENKNVPEIPTVEYILLPPIDSDNQEKTIEDFHHFLIKNSIDILWVHSPIEQLIKFVNAAAKGTSAKIVSIYHSTPYSQIRESRDFLDLHAYQSRHYGKKIPYLKVLTRYPLKLINAFRRMRKTLRNIANNSDVVALLSEYYVSEFMRLSGIRDKNKITYVTNPLLAPAQSLQNDIEKKDQLLVVGRHEWKNKRLDRILQIWQKIQHRFPSWQLTILGDGPAHDEYKRHAERLQLERISFLGKQVPDTYYAESKIICMTSSWEGLPMVLLEAQRYGCVPIAYASFTALRDIIIQGETGYSISPFKENQYIEQLTKLMQDEDLLQRMAQNCRKHSTNFSLDKVAAAWLKLFDSLTS